MSEKRRDNRGRILHVGESQRQDGRYAYKYKNLNGDYKYVYSWRLDKNDRTPAGRARDLSLREKERQIQQDLFKRIVPNGGDLTVLELVEKYLSLKVNVRHNTRANYNFVLNIIRKEDFGKMRIDKVKQSDAKAWLIKMQKVDGRGYSSIHSIRGVVRPAFEMALQDDLINRNPFQFELATVVVNDSVTREAITRAQERAFLKFIQEDKCFGKYYDGIFILFNTGLRVSEFCGLTISDIDFKKKRIRIDHQLQRARNMEYVIEDTKTKNGERFVPMSPEVIACFRRVIANRKKPAKEPMIDGYTGFLFLDKNEMPMVALHWEHYFKHIRAKYNKIYRIQLPKITPHVCRHTFCSNMAKSGMNPKTLQYIMGHADMKDLVLKAGVAARFRISSGAVSREEVGNPVYPPARRELEKHGIFCRGHRAHQITAAEYADTDRVYYMDASNLRYLKRLLPDTQRCWPLLEREVADPWYTGDFEATWRDILEGCTKILEEFV